MSHLAQDVRHALRRMARHPAMALAVILTLALGLGVNSGIFSVFRAVLLQALPYGDPDRLVFIYGSMDELGMEQLWPSGPEFLDLREQGSLFEEISILRPRDLSLTGRPEPLPIKAVAVSHNFFDVLAVPPFLGRDFLPEEDQPGGEKVTVLSYAAWQRLLGGAADVLDQEISLNDQVHRIVGVMPEDFKVLPPDSLLPDRVDLWVPVARHVDRFPRDLWIFNVFARLAPGVSPEQAQAELESIRSRLAEESPEIYQDRGWRLYLRPFHEHLTAESRPALRILLAMTALVLLIACANVACLLLALATGRSQEFAVRGALGASRRRLVQQSLVETLLLVLVGAGLALFFAALGVRFLSASGGARLPRLEQASIDPWVVAFTLLAAVLATTIAGLAPALASSRSNLADAFRSQKTSAQGGRIGQRLLAVLVVVELALALLPLVAAGLLGKSYLRLLDVDPGFRQERVLSMLVKPPRQKYPAREDKRGFYNRILERLGALPGVQSVGATSHLPFSDAYTSSTFEVELGGTVTEEREFQADIRSVDPGYFETLGIPLVTGRLFNNLDEEGSPRVIVVSRTLADTIWPAEEAVGRRIRYAGQENWFEVVGVVEYVEHESLAGEAGEQVYFPLDQVPWVHSYFVLRTLNDPATMLQTAQTAVWSVDGDQAVADVRTLESYVEDSLAQSRFFLLLIGLSAALALLLAALGTYGVMAYAAAQRTREVGLRMALGARRIDVLALIVRRGLLLAAAGVVLGLLGVLGMMRFLAHLIYGIGLFDPGVYVAAILLLLFLGAVASFIPARRAATIDPNRALSYE